MLYYGLYICLECFLAFQVLRLVWVYWIRRPVSAHSWHIRHRAETSAGL